MQIRTLKGVDVEVDFENETKVGTILPTTFEYAPKHNEKNYFGIFFTDGMIANIRRDFFKITNPVIAIETKKEGVVKCGIYQFKPEYTKDGKLKAVSLCEKKDDKKSFKLIKKYPVSQLLGISLKLNLFIHISLF